MKKKKPVTSAGYLLKKPSDDLGIALHSSTNTKLHKIHDTWQKLLKQQ
jgi:hypothetical protein